MPARHHNRRARYIDDLMPEGWILLGQVIALSGQLLADLSLAANDLEALLDSAGSTDTAVVSS